jgi:hypothetical protein
MPQILQEVLPRMTELDVLDRDIGRLRELLRVAWRHLTNPQLTPFERREARDAIKQCSAELREYLLAIEAERASRKQSLEQGGRSSTKPLDPARLARPAAKRNPPARTGGLLSCLKPLFCETDREVMTILKGGRVLRTIALIKVSIAKEVSS